MASPESWLEVLALAKALFESAKAGIDFISTYRHYRNDPETIAESRRVSVVFSTYSDEEIETASRRLKDCQDRFVREGSGTQRARCLCSVLNDFKTGNGGQLPLVDDWQRIYSQLGCGGLG